MFQSYAIFRKFWLRKYDGGDVSSMEQSGLAYAVEIERSAARMAGSSELQQLALRVTTVFRREGGQWKVVHRHADPLMSVKQYGK
jgi:ketosteroid isomerase-like protein